MTTWSLSTVFFPFSFPLLFFLIASPSPRTSPSPAVLLSLPSDATKPSADLNISLSNTATLDAWPPLPYTYPLRGTPTYLLILRSLSPIGNATKTALAWRLFASEIDLIATQPRQFDPYGISLARKFTDIYLRCYGGAVHRKSRAWTIDIAIEMLRVLGSLIGKWGFRDFEFEVWEAQTREMLRRVWRVNAYDKQDSDMQADT